MTRPAGTWQNCEENRRAAISPVRGQGLLSFENDCVVRERIDVVFPVMHGENCETCLDITRLYLKLKAEGKTLKEIREAVEKQYTGSKPTDTPRP